MLFNPMDAYIGGSLDAYGEFSEGEVGLFRQILRPGATALDIGANIGALTLPMARMVGDAGRVIAWEPQRIVFQTLCANLALNGVGNVTALLAAATRAPGQVSVPQPDYARPGNFGALSLAGATAGEAVEGRPVDALGLSACDFMKVDVEGMEREVLAGAAATIVRHRPVLYVENDRPEQSEALLAAILGLGYRAWWHLPPLFDRENFRGNRENIFPGTVSVNVLALPRESRFGAARMTEILAPDSDWRAARR